MAKSKNKNFKDWMQSEDDEWGDKEPRFTKKDGKRYDKKKSRIQSARRTKNKNKFSHLE